MLVVTVNVFVCNRYFSFKSSTFYPTATTVLSRDEITPETGKIGYVYAQSFNS